MMDPLAGIDPKLLQYLKAQGLSREDIVRNVGVQQVIDSDEARRVQDKKMEEMRSPQMQEHLRSEIAAGIEGDKQRLMATTNPAELQAHLRSIAVTALQRTANTTVTASSASKQG